jgi:suppressor of ftsI
MVFLLTFLLTAAPALGQQMDMSQMGSGDSLAWRMPPGDGSPNMAMMMAPFMGLLPAVSPFLPGPGMDVDMLPEASVGGTLPLADGDTVRLEGQVLRREINGRAVAVYGFNGQSPGPTFRVPQGATIVVEFTNHIDFATTLRWHGVRVENRFDGVPGQTQSPVQVGATYTAEVHFPDAGIFWYHPHQRAHIAQDLGMYGNIIVEPRDPDYYSPVNSEETLILDDVLLDEGGWIPFGFEAPSHALMGRFGNVFLTNGEPGFRKEVKKGDVVRLFITDASNSRPFNLRIEGGVRMKLVAGDLGKFEREEWVPTVIIAPGQRYVVEARFEEEGDFALTNRITAIDHWMGEFRYEVDTLGVFSVSSDDTDEDYGAEFETLRTNAEVTAEFEAVRAQADRSVDEELVLSLQIGELPIPVIQMMEIDTLYYPPVEFNDPMPMMNWLSTGMDVQWLLHEPDPDANPRDLGPARGWRFNQGDLVKIRLFNTAESWHPMSHPLHLHGQRFVVIEQDGVRSQNLVWRDTVLVPVGSTVDLLVEMSNPGTWMLNCQIPEHVGSGMAMTFTVRPSG